MSSLLSSLHALSAHFYPSSLQEQLWNHAARGERQRNGRLSFTVRGFCVSGDSLVEEGEQVAHHHQRRPRDTQQDLTDALRPLVHVLDPCSEKKWHQEVRHSDTSGKTPAGATEGDAAGFLLPLWRGVSFRKRHSRETKTTELSVGWDSVFNSTSGQTTFLCRTRIKQTCVSVLDVLGWYQYKYWRI